ncbi:uncharacterized protein LOC117639473 [Thrips palmi]|uniref:Uncharacterized protein LOC117639473 n=1 Tax=Thrips palmi TaxID=161013 RepID=A0A6P8YB96_THRPL|nr:uncharacterized protein LOC117639473 [Thrips palmi]
MGVLLHSEEFEECSLFNDNSELSKHQQLSTKNQEVISAKVDLLTKLFLQLFPLDQALDHSQLGKLKFERDELISQVNKCQNDSDVFLKKSQELLDVVADKRNECQCLSDHLGLMKSEVAELTRDSKQQQSKYRLALDSFKLGKKKYKDMLGCHVSLLHANGENIEFLLSYNKTRPLSLDPIPSNSIKFLFNATKKTWKVLESNPTLDNFEQLALKLDESQDILQFVAHLQPK